MTTPNRLENYADEDILYVVLRDDVVAVAESHLLPVPTPDRMRLAQRGIEAYFGEALEDVILSALEG